MRSNDNGAYIKLDPEHAKRLRDMVKLSGFTRAATILRSSVPTLEALASGGTARWDTVRRIEGTLSALDE